VSSLESKYLDLTLDEFEKLSFPPIIGELSISEAQTMPLFKVHEDVQDPKNIHVSYDMFIKLPPQVKSLIMKHKRLRVEISHAKLTSMRSVESCQLILLLYNANGAELQ